VFGGGDGDAPVGSDMEVKRFLQLMTMDAAKRLSYDRGIQTAQSAPAQAPE